MTPAGPAARPKRRARPPRAPKRARNGAGIPLGMPARHPAASAARQAAPRAAQPAPAPPQPAAVEQAAMLQRILASQTFRQVARLKRFLEFITTETLAGRGAALKEYVIGVQVFDKEHTFDPRADPIVRVQARRLRARLERYYRDEGGADETVIELPKGGYAPVFRSRDQMPASDTRPIGSAVASANTVTIDTIADLSLEQNLGPVCEGLRAELVQALTSLRGLRVLSALAPAAASASAVGVHVTGSVRRTDDQLRLTASVVNGQTGAYVGATSVDVPVAKLVSGQEAIAAFVVQTLRPRTLDIADPRRAARPAENLAARNLYLQGRYHLAQRTEASLNKAVEFFESALAEDPQYALAHSGLADAYGLLTNYGVRGPADVWTKAASHAASGVMLDPQAVETRTTLAHVKAIQDWDWAGAEREFAAAIQLSPDYATAHHWLAVSCLVPLGRIHDAMQEMLLAQSLDPVSAIVARDVANLHLYRRDLDAALEQCDHTIGLNPHFSAAYLTLGLIQEQRKDLDEALAALQRAIDLAPTSPRMQAALGRMLAVAGKRDQATAILKKLEDVSRQRYVSPYDVACIRLALGQDELAFKWLARAARDRCFEMLALRYDPRVDAVRRDRRLDAIAAKIGVK